MVRRLPFPVLLACVLLLLACSSLPDEFSAPDFTVEDIFTGDEIRLADYKGRPVVLYFFASW